MVKNEMSNLVEKTQGLEAARGNAHRALPSEARIAWLFNCAGTPDSLLYWNQILPPYLERFPCSDFYSARPPSKVISGTPKSVEYAGAWHVPLGRRQNSYDRQLVVPAPGILRRLRATRPDLIVVQELLAYAIYVAVCRRWLPNSRVLLLLESDPIRGISARRHAAVSWIRRFAARRMDWCLTNNDSGRQYLLNELQFPEQRILVKPYLVSEPPATLADGDAQLCWSAFPESLRGDRDKTIFLYVGQLIPRKGVRQLMDAIAQMKDHHRERARFWLVGDGSQRQELEERMQQAGLANYVRFVGSVAYENLARFYRAASCFVMPTLDDYRALVGFEALRYGLPLLHSRYDGAVAELVLPGINGEVIDPYDPQEFGCAMGRMIDNAAEMPRMGAASAARAQESFTVKAAVDNLCFAIDHCLND